MAKKQSQPKKQTAAEGPGLLTPFTGKSTEAPAEGHRTNAGEADTVDSPGLGKQAMAEIYDAIGADWEPEEGVKEAAHDGEGSCGEGKCGEGSCGGKKKKAKKKLKKKAGMPFLDQDRPAKVKEVYKALKRDHPQYSAEKKARIASSMAKKADKSEFETEISNEGNQEKMKSMMEHHARQNFGKTTKQMSRHERKAASELVMNHPHFQKIKAKHNVTHHDPVSKTTVEDVAKKAEYIPESERLHKLIRDHARKGHRAELKRLMSEEGKKGGRKGGLTGAALGALAGGAAGAAKGKSLAHALGGAAGGAVAGGVGGYQIGAGPGRKRGREEAERRLDAVKATRRLTPAQRIRYFEQLAEDRRHEERMSRKKKDFDKKALMQTAIQDSPSHRAGVVAGMEAAAKCDPELDRHLQDANARNWPVGRARTSMEMSRSGEFKTHD